MDNIFDIKNIEDLSAGCREAISLGKETYKFKILKLFAMKDTLNTTEIIVGLYRLYKIEISRQRIGGIIHNMIAIGDLKRTSQRGEFTIIK